MIIILTIQILETIIYDKFTVDPLKVFSQTRNVRWQESKAYRQDKATTLSCDPLHLDSNLKLNLNIKQTEYLGSEKKIQVRISHKKPHTRIGSDRI